MYTLTALAQWGAEASSVVLEKQNPALLTPTPAHAPVNAQMYTLTALVQWGAGPVVDSASMNLYVGTCEKKFFFGSVGITLPQGICLDAFGDLWE